MTHQSAHEPRVRPQHKAQFDKVPLQS